MKDKFKEGDIVICTQSLKDYGYFKGNTYRIAQGETCLKIVHPDRGEISWIFANHELVMPCFELAEKKKRPKYADWAHA